MLLSQVNRIYVNASDFSVAERVLPAHDVLDPLVGMARLWKELIREDDHDSKQLFFSVWRLCHDVTSCLVPFDSPDLGLGSRLKNIVADASRYPSLSRQLDELKERITWLLSHPENPKGEVIFRTIDEHTVGRRSIGLVSRMSRIVTSGWQEDFARVFEEAAPGCKLIKTRRDLLDSILDVIILPGAGKLCPFRSDLYTLYRSKQLIVVRYLKERTAPPRIPKLPESTATRQSVDLPAEVIDSGSAEEDGLEDWVTNEEWELARLRAQNAGHNFGPSSFQFLVLARLVLLESGDAVYLQEDRKVIEVSPLLSDQGASLESASRIPRKLPRQLRSGDLIGLRTSGSGDYLDVVADQLLREAGKGDLRQQSTDWKKELEELLQQIGPDFVAEKMASRGSTASSANYIWHWATDDVIRPQKMETFANLIRVTSESGWLANISDLDKYINEKWLQMQELIRYQHKAGIRIRKILIKELLERLKSATSFTDDTVTLRLPDVDAGEITLFRVAGVESEASEVPYTRVNMVF